MSERPADPCDGARQRIAEMVLAWEDSGRDLYAEAFAAEIVAAEIAPLVEALVAMAREHRIATDLAQEANDRLLAILDRVRTPTDRSESDGE